MALTAFDVIDFNAPGGAKLQAYLEERLNELRRKNDEPGLDAIGTAGLRGQIMELKLLLRARPAVVKVPSYSNMASLNHQGGTA